MIVLDASVLIAHLDPDDAHHRASSRVLETDDELLAHRITMAEVLVGGVRIDQGLEMQDDLVRLGVVAAESDDGEPLRLAHLRVATTLRLPDCCVLDVALRNRCALATFDLRLATAARHLGLVVVGA